MLIDIVKEAIPKIKISTMFELDSININDVIKIKVLFFLNKFCYFFFYYYFY